MDIETSLKRIFLKDTALVSLKTQLYKKQFRCRVSECSDLEKYRAKNANQLMQSDQISSHLLWLRCTQDCGRNLLLAQKYQKLLYEEMRTEITKFMDSCKGEECMSQAQKKLDTEIKPIVEAQLKQYFESKLKD